VEGPHVMPWCDGLEGCCDAAVEGCVGCECGCDATSEGCACYEFCWVVALEGYGVCEGR